MTDPQKLQNNNWYVNMKKYCIPQVQYYDEQTVIVNGVSYTRTEPTPIVIQEDENTIVVAGVKYQRMEDPKPQTLKDIISEWIVIYNIRSDSVKDRITADLLERIETKWLPDEVEVDTEEYNAGWNDAIKTLKDKLR